MHTLEKMLSILVKALSEISARKESVREFQRCFWDNQLHIKSSIGENAYNILADLAYDLDFFEADPGVRAQDTTYYGDERLDREIEVALKRLSELGIAVPSK
jgi:hypothetical protein